MAGVGASVSAGHTVLPYLVDGVDKPKAMGKPLTADEADQLQQMMRAVVTSGSGRVLSGGRGGHRLDRHGGVRPQGAVQDARLDDRGQR